MSSISMKSRRELLKQGVPEFIKGWRCSECDKPTGSTDRSERHYYQDEYDDQVELVRKTRDPEEEKIRIRLSKLMYTTSRCCGAAFIVVQVSYHQILWELFRNRHELIPQKKIPRLRREYGEGESRHTDDFIRMQVLLSVADQKAVAITEIFVAEERLMESQVA